MEASEGTKQKGQIARDMGRQKGLCPPSVVKTVGPGHHKPLTLGVDTEDWLLQGLKLSCETWDWPFRLSLESGKAKVSVRTSVEKGQLRCPATPHCPPRWSDIRIETQEQLFPFSLVRVTSSPFSKYTKLVDFVSKFSLAPSGFVFIN